MLTWMTADSKIKLDAATLLRDSLDAYTNGPGYPIFLKRIIPLVIIILKGPCLFQSTSPEQVSCFAPDAQLGPY